MGQGQIKTRRGGRASKRESHLVLQLFILPQLLEHQ